MPALTPLDPPVNVKIAEDGSASGAAFYIADAKGYFKEMGINVEFVTFQSSDDAACRRHRSGATAGGIISPACSTLLAGVLM
ncbi:MAG: ABC transporter substrate-binding protein [Anaerolineae bacterium]